MKKIILPLLAILFLISCNNTGNNNDTGYQKKEIPKTKTDSLLADVMAGHDAVMPKMGKIRGAQKEAHRLLDSIASLPVKSQKSSIQLKTALESLISKLNTADYAMDKWMTEFIMDSASSNAEKRINYLSAEKIKVENVKDAVLNSLAAADSVFKSKN